MSLKIPLPCLPTLVAMALSASGLSADEITAQQVEFFESKIRPVLAENCYQCHNSIDKKKGDIALDYKAALEEAEIIVPGDPEQSTLIQAIRHAEGFEPMPSKSPKLAKLVVKNFEEWVRMGAPDPRLEKPSKEELENQVDWAAVRDKRAEWWSFQPIRKVESPQVDDPEWNQSEIDRFVHAGLDTAGLQPQERADPGTLVRRLHLILIGMPPSPDVVEKFVDDPSEKAYAAMVDELMDSKEYGERWGRYWLDWFRYAESYGSEGDPAVPYARQYRDYVIRAINADVPYDQLIREHLAGDLLESPRINDELGLNESAIGPAQMRMVPHGFGVTDAYDEQITFTDNQIDAVSKAMLGITVSCARCHNHKFDPISQADFYKFYGIMISSRPAIVNVDSPELQELHVGAIEKLKLDVRRDFGAHWLKQLDEAIVRLDRMSLQKVPPTDPLEAWSKLRDLKPGQIVEQLKVMRQAYEAGIGRNEQTKAEATFYADLRDQETFDQWFKSGNGLGSGVSPAGSFAMATEGPNAIAGIYPSGVYSHLISDKHSGFLNSVFHLANGERASVRAMGAGSNARFTVRSYPLVHGGLHPAPGLKPESQWVNLNKYKYWNGEKGYFQVNTGPDNTAKEGGGRSWFGVFEAYAGSGNLQYLGFPLVTLPGDLARVTGRASLLEFYKSALRDSIEAWSQNREMTDAQAELLNSFVGQGLLGNRVDVLPAELKARVEAYRELEGEVRIPERAPGFIAGEPWDQPLLERGNYKEEKDAVPRGFLEVFGGRTYDPAGCGRLELAQDMVSETNTLTARVIVNRLWHHTFGRGLVASTDNFGRLGKEPTHPQLLDYLAADLRENDWSMKHTVRQLVMSRAFRSASSPPEANGDKDPENLMLAYFTPRRLDAEAILDTIRFVANDSVPSRAVYNRVKRNALDPFLTTFNFPIPTSTVGVRDLTNVPAQSLTLMNGNVTRTAASQWSQRVTSIGDLESDADRIDRLFMQAYSRHPSSEEIDACIEYLNGKAEDDTGELVASRRKLQMELEALREDREAVVAEVRQRLQAEVDRRNATKKAAAPRAVDLKPVARWDFEDDAKDQVGGMHGKVVGRAKVEGGALVLEGGCLMTEPVSGAIGARSVEALVQLDTLEQRAGGVMVLQDLVGNVFDGIVFAEVDRNTWLSGSDHHRRTQPFGGEPDSEAAGRPVRLVIVYDSDGTVRCYRDGVPYGKPYKTGQPITHAPGKAQVVFGLRHGKGPTNGRMLTGKIMEARLYDRALTAEEVAAASDGVLLEVVSREMLEEALSEEQKTMVQGLDDHIAKRSTELGRVERQLEARNARGAAGGDAWFRLAHALLNSKELIYVY